MEKELDSYVIFYIGNLVSGHIYGQAGCFQVIICFILSSFCFINISADLCHIDVSCPVSVNEKQEEQLKDANMLMVLLLCSKGNVTFPLTETESFDSMK